MFKEHTTEEIIKMMNEAVETNKDGTITVTLKNKKQVTIEELKSNLANFLNEKIGQLGRFPKEVELLEIILENSQKNQCNTSDVTVKLPCGAEVVTPNIYTCQFEKK